MRREREREEIAEGISHVKEEEEGVGWLSAFLFHRITFIHYIRHFSTRFKS